MSRGPTSWDISRNSPTTRPTPASSTAATAFSSDGTPAPPPVASNHRPTPTATGRQRGTGPAGECRDGGGSGAASCWRGPYGRRAGGGYYGGGRERALPAPGGSGAADGRWGWPTTDGGWERGRGRGRAGGRGR